MSKRQLYREGTCQDKFTIGKLLGQGSFGEVYKAYYTDDKNKKPIALKTFKLGATPFNNDIAMELVDGVIGAYLYHKGCEVTKVLEARKCSDYGARSFLIAMDYVDGDTLQELFDDGDVSNTLKFAITEKLLREFTCLHNHKIYHRDIKLANLMISFEDPGVDNDYINVVVIDFGLGCAKFAPDFRKFAAKNVGEKMFTNLMNNSCIKGDVGTRLYMPPEDFWFQYAHPDEEINMIMKDSYALGCALYEIWELDGKALYSNMEGINTFGAIKEFLKNQLYYYRKPPRISSEKAPRAIIDIVQGLMNYINKDRLIITNAYKLFLKSRSDSLKFVLASSDTPQDVQPEAVAASSSGVPPVMHRYPPGLNFAYPKDRLVRAANFRDVKDVLPKGLPSDWWKSSRMKELGYLEDSIDTSEVEESLFEIPFSPKMVPPSGLRTVKKASDRPSLKCVYKIVPPSGRPRCNDE